jgi:hypothetical protein
VFDFVCSQDDANFNHVGKEVKGRTHTFYQVLIDSRDCPYIVGTGAHISIYIMLEKDKLEES